MENPPFMPPGVFPNPELHGKLLRVEIVLPFADDKDALTIRAAISEALRDFKEKRFTFTIIET